MGTFDEIDRIMDRNKELLEALENLVYWLDDEGDWSEYDQVIAAKQVIAKVNC